MQVFNILKYGDKLPNLIPSAALIGNLDGMHLGHDHLIKVLEEQKTKHTIITFSNLNKDGLVLSTKADKIDLLEKYDIDYLIILNFNQFKNIFYNEFIRLLKKLNIEEVVCGSDFRFGFKKEGDLFDLSSAFKVIEVPDFMIDGKRISSSMIKKMNTLEEMEKYLGHHHIIRGKVIEGSHVGETIGFKTANLDVSKYKLPEDGVYACKVSFLGRDYVGVLSIGHNPTINYQEEKRVEVHIIDFYRTIYGETLKIEFIQYIDKIYKFADSEQLIQNIKKYVEIAKKLVALS